MPVSVDTDRLAEELPKIFNLALPQMEAGNIHRDPTVRHYGIKADVLKEGEGGHYWLIAGGDVVLFASSQVPAAERHIWNPTFERLLTTLEITRDEELALRKLTNEVLMLLRERHPEHDFQHDEKGIRGRNRVVFLSNLHREVRAAPARRDQIIEHFVRSLGQSMDLTLGQESWEDAQPRLLPLLKPRLPRLRFRQPFFTRKRMACQCDNLLCPAEQRYFPVRHHCGRGPMADGSRRRSPSGHSKTCAGSTGRPKWKGRGNGTEGE